MIYVLDKSLIGNKADRFIRDCDGTKYLVLLRPEK